MRRKTVIWIIIIAAGILCGTGSGILAHTMIRPTNRTGTRSAGSGNEGNSDTPGAGGQEDFSEYYGTYTPKAGQTILLQNTKDTSLEDISHSVQQGALLYIGNVRSGSSGQLEGEVDFLSLGSWVPLDSLDKLCDDDCSLQIWDECVVNDSISGVEMKMDASEDSESYEMTVSPGTAVRGMDSKNGYLRVKLTDESSATYTGWLPLSSVTKYSAGLKYRMYNPEGTSRGEEVPCYKNRPASMDIITDDPCGCVYEEDVLQFDSFDGPWGYQSKIDGWFNLLNCMPLPASEAENYRFIASSSAGPTPVPETAPPTPAVTEPTPAPATPTPTPTPTPQPQGRTDFYKDGSVVTADAFIVPGLDNHYITGAELDALTLKGVSYAKNELYAKYGRKFVSPELIEYMGTKTWYTGKYEPGSRDSEIVGWMNAYERHNLDELVARENALGPYVYN